MFKLATTSSIYFLIILPLISSLLCYVSRKRNVNYIIYLISTAVCLVIILKQILKVINFSKIANDFETSTISIIQEFQLDIISLFFLLIITYIKLITNSSFHFEFENKLSDELNQKTYAVLLLNIFAINSILLTNNIFNLFIFCEIYIFTFLAICSLASDSKVLKSTFNYYCLSSASSLLFLISFISIYLCFGETSFTKIVDNFALISSKNYWYLLLILFSITLAIILKFFPVWLFYNNIKSNNNLSDISIIEVFFVTCLLGIYLSLKFINSFFGNNLLFLKFNYDILLILLCAVMISYSSVKIVKEKHLKIIAINLSLSNFGLILLALAIQNIYSLKALFYFIITNVSSNLMLYIFAIFLKKNFRTSSIEQIYFPQKVHYLLNIFLKIFISFVIGIPFTLLFFANYYLCMSLFEYKYMAIVLAIIIMVNFAYFKLGLNLFNSLYSSNNQEKENNFITNKLFNKKVFQITFFSNLAFIFFLIFNISYLEKFSNKFAQYFLL